MASIATQPLARFPSQAFVRSLRLRHGLAAVSGHVCISGASLVYFHTSSSRPTASTNSGERSYRYVSGPTKKKHVVPKSEQWYRFYLSTFKIRLLPFEPGKNLLSLDVKQLEQGLSPELLKDPLSAFEDASGVDIDCAGRCLCIHIHRIRAQANGEKALIRQSHITAKAGIRALHWLIESGCHRDTEFFSRQVFIQGLTYCIVAERKEDFLWDFLLLDHRERVAALRWQDVIIRHLVEMQAYWSDNREDVLQESVITYMRAVKSAQSRRVSVSASIAGIWIARQIELTDATIRDPQFGIFLETYSRSRRGPLDSMWVRAALLIGAVGDPSILMFWLKSCRDRTHGYCDSVRTQDFCENATWNPAAASLLVNTVKAARLYVKQDALKKAKLMLNTAYELRPDIFTGYPTHKRYSTKQPHIIRRRPSPYEASLNMPLDRDGFVRLYPGVKFSSARDLLGTSHPQ